MNQITITEALADIKLITKKLETKVQFVQNNLTRYKHVPDPLGNGADAIRAEVQSISDLRQRLVALRGAIAKANLENTITISDKTQSIQNWLTWKRECAADELAFFNKVHTLVKQSIDANASRPQLYKDDPNAQPKVVEIETNVNYVEFVERAQRTQENLDKLDGQLSLKNATILVTV